MADALAVGPHRFDGRIDGTPGRTPADDQHIAFAVSGDLSRRNVFGDAGHLARPQLDHVLVVVGLIGDVAGAVLLFDPADAVHELRGTRKRPLPGKGLRIADVGPMDGLAIGVGLVRSGRIGR